MTALALQGSCSYPVKIISRSAAIRRKRKSRLALGGIAGTVLAVAFAIGCTSALTPLSKPSQLATTLPAPAMTPIPVAEMIDPMTAMLPSPSPSKSLETIVAAENNHIAPVSLPVVLHESAPAPAPVTYPRAVTLTVKNGDTLASLLSRAGSDAGEARAIMASIHPYYDAKHLDAGQTVSLTLGKPSAPGSAAIIKNLKMPVSPLASLEVSRNGEDFAVKKVNAPLERKLARAGGTIDSSFYETAVGSGLPPALLSEIINAYSYDIDFQRDIKQGDSMDVLYERLQTKDGAVAGHGNIIYTELDLGDRQLKIFRYVDKSGNADYYTESGESIRKALLRTPINGARITSGFGLRNHPLLGYTRMHRGVDFGAPIGTPIYAAGDGTVEFVGRKNGYGNYLKIKHNDKYASAYAHISRFAGGIAPGHKVKQGQIIAYVGMTGMATGPHLHYEILVNNEQVNPANVKFKTGNVLQGKELYAFRKSMAQIQTQLASLPHSGNKVAMLDAKQAELN